MNKYIHQVSFVLLFFSGQVTFSQECNSNAGSDIIICDGDGSNSNYTHLNGSLSSISSGDINYEWTVLNSVGDGSNDETLVITSGESDEVDPRFKYPEDLSADTEFLVQLRIFNDENTCESLDTVSVTIKSNMCPRSDAGDDQALSNGCDFLLTLDGSGSEDPQDEEISFQWRSLDGLDGNLINSNSANATFEFPSTDSDQSFYFVLTVTDSEQSSSDTMQVLYSDNDAPIANAGGNVTSCEYQFYLTGKQSYDINKNSLSYSWSSLDGLELSETSSSKSLITSPINLNEDTSYRIALEVFDGSCYGYDTTLVTIKANLCPVAEAGKDARIPKFQAQSVMLDASLSTDADGEIVSYEWKDPDGVILQDARIEVLDLNLDLDYSKYVYTLKVVDNENSISEDTVNVIFSNFSSPSSPTVYAVASHGQVLISWDASSEASYDSLTGYSDFEGYKLYRSIDGGETWGGDKDKLYNFNGDFVGWVPYAQFDYSYNEDYNHCIYNHNGDCESEDMRNVSVSGLDPYLPRFSLGSNTGLEYSYVDSNVIDGVEYSYTVTAYDMGLPKIELSLTESDSSGIFDADTIWGSSNPARFIGPDSIIFYNNFRAKIRSEENPQRGFPFLESNKGDSSSHNFITVVPGYTALDIAFPEASDIEALFTSSAENIGTGDRDYFIVDRNNIVQDMVKYEIQASQSSSAVDGMACEDPQVYGFVVSDSLGTPKNTLTYYENNLTYLEKDSLSGLPGAVLENESIIIPDYNVISSVDKWSEQFKGIRFKMENKIPLNISAVPTVSLDTTLWSWSEPDSLEMDSATAFNLNYAMYPFLSYTNVASYLRRLNFDYKIEFFSEPVGDTISITNASGLGKMYFPFRITNMWTGKKVGLGCNDYGSFDASPIDFSNGAGNYVWTPGEDIFLIKDSLKIGGLWVEAYNYNLDLAIPLSNSVKSNRAYNSNKSYDLGEEVFFQGSLWYAFTPADAGIEPVSVHEDMEDDGERNNPWRPVYPWQGGSSSWAGEEFAIGPGDKELLIKPNKLFVDGDNWFSDMSKLGEQVGISDTLCLDSIKVVPNPYKAASAFNETPNSRKIRFTHLPTSCQISIYTVAGEHVTTFKHEKQFDGNSWWNLRSGNNQDGPEVAPGLYIYTIEFEKEKEYCVDTYDADGDIQGSEKNDYYTNNKYDLNEDGTPARIKKKTKFHIGKFAVIR